MLYGVTTWDSDLQEFTPQIGVPVGPYTLFGLRPALRALRQMGYGGVRSVSLDVSEWLPGVGPNVPELPKSAMPRGEEQL